MLKVLFFIHDLGQGGAEKVLVNLVNNMDKSKFDITVMSIFGGGVNEQFLTPDVKYITCFKKEFRGNSHIMKLFSPEQLHKMFINDTYDIEIAYLEGPSTRIISGCPDKNTKLINWIHCTLDSEQSFSIGYRSFSEAVKCAEKFINTVFVSENAKDAYCKFTEPQKGIVLYNTNDSTRILSMSTDSIDCFKSDEFNVVAVGKIVTVKGFNRLANVHCKLRKNGYKLHTYILGNGDLSIKNDIETKVKSENEQDTFTFLGFQANPYKFVSKADLFVCSSISEGFSTAATEALILGVPVVTTEVSGMKEMLGKNNEYGIVTANNEEALYLGIKKLLDDKELYNHYKKQAEIRGKNFNTTQTVKAVEDMLLSL